MEDTGAPRGTGERGHGVGSVVFIHKATATKFSSVLIIKILELHVDGIKIRSSGSRSLFNF